MKIGDVVRLPIGPEMMISHVRVDESRVVAVWFTTDGKLEREEFNVEYLTPVPFVDRRLRAVDDICREALRGDWGAPGTVATTMARTIQNILKEPP